MKLKFRIVLLFFLITQIHLIAQNNKNSTEEITSKNESYLLTDISFINDAVFMGRLDSIAAPYIFPSIGYYDKSGFYVDVSASYLTNASENRIDLFLGSLGYNFEDKNWRGGISGTTYFFNEDSYNVKSEIIGDISGFLSYDLKVIQASLFVSTYFNNGSSADIFGGFMLDRTFYSKDNSFLINPSAILYAGSQNFYQEYYSTSRLGNRKGKGQASGASEPTTVATNIEVKEASKFKILNLELSLPIQYYYKSYIFSFTPVLALPQTPATITTTDAIIAEDLESVFYFSVGIGYWFTTKKKKP
ncbi:hypothetical protein [Cellulophaga sp. Hel_I_12]|uniref:hypothetical protein n=1 Tax=Cellulophaga sp. Hel_I_12 TaxID=1249972 RepID=UPI000647E00D|nr:hypothetical protein [Cellulophaga sp. Hel_I_12]